MTKDFPNIILDRIKRHFRLNSDTELSKFLGVAKQTISNWRLKGAIDTTIIIEHCKNIDYNKLFDMNDQETNIDLSLNKTAELLNKELDLQVKKYNIESNKLETDNNFLETEIKKIHLEIEEIRKGLANNDKLLSIVGNLTAK